jgi:hypothetical protein
LEFFTLVFISSSLLTKEEMVAEEEEEEEAEDDRCLFLLKAIRRFRAKAASLMLSCVAMSL